jgi:hypothetical protein
MLSFSLPVLAAEVKLVCSWVDKDGDKISKEIAFNEATKTVSIYGEAYPVIRSTYPDKHAINYF